jgi:hypothetical protein
VSQSDMTASSSLMGRVYKREEDSDPAHGESIKKIGQINKQLIIMDFMVFIFHSLVFTAEQCFLITITSGR